MNQIVDRLTHKCPIHDVDCIYRNPRRDFWMAFEWKFPGERPGTSSTQRSIQELDVAFSCTDHTYRGFFIVQIGTSLDAGFPFDDTQQMAVVHLHHGEMLANTLQLFVWIENACASFHFCMRPAES